MASIDTFLGSSLTNLNSLSSKINSEDENMKTVVEYLYTLTEQLRYIFNHIDEENMTDGVVQNIVKEETQSQYAHFTETETSITAVIQGLNAAQQAVKVIFDAAGLTIKNGGFQILNNNNQAVFSANNSGDLTMKGTFVTNTTSAGGSNWHCELDGTALELYKGNTMKAVLGATSNDATTALVAQNVLIANTVSSPISSFSNAIVYFGRDGTESGYIYVRNTDLNAMFQIGTLNSDKTQSAMSLFSAGTEKFRTTAYSDHVRTIYRNNSGTTKISLEVTTGGSGDITADNYNNNSSRRYKTDINDMSIEDANKLLDQQFVKFRYKGRDTYNYGLIAEDTDIEEAVTLDDEGRPDAIDYTKLIPYMGRLIQEQEKRIRRLEDERNS